jgi:hypothetical protein
MNSFVWQIRCIFICFIIAGVLVYGFVPGIGVWIIAITAFTAAVLVILESIVRCVFERYPRHPVMSRTVRPPHSSNYIIISNPGGELSVGFHMVYIQRPHT